MYLHELVNGQFFVFDDDHLEIVYMARGNFVTLWNGTRILLLCVIQEKGYIKTADSNLAVTLVEL